ncbi:MAG: hypothetical protein ACJAVY_001575 [Marinoscillum sp.]|jgi:hypothetical protein
MKKITLLFLLVASSNILLAQLSLLEISQLEDKQFFKNTFLSSPMLEDFRQGVKKGEVTKEELKLERIGLITFFQAENEINKEKAQAFSYGYKTKSANTIINEIFAQSIAPMKAALKEKGTTLLLPNEFIEGEAAQSKYNQVLGQIKTLNGKKEPIYEMESTTSYRSTPEGIDYVGVWLDNGQNQEVLNLLATLAKEINVDGFLMVRNTTQFYGFSEALGSILLQIYIPHPEPNPKKEIYGYQLGQLEFVPDAPTGFIGIKKDEVSGEDYSAFPNLLSRCGADFINFLNSEKSELFK